MHHINAKNMIIVLLLIFGAAFAFYTTKQSSKTHIDGNVLHLPYFTGSPLGSQTMPTWINNGLISYLLLDTLLLASPDLKTFTPRLAESFTQDEMGLTYTFNIRKNIKWSDGADFSIEDLVFSIKTASAQGNLGRVYDDALEKIINITSDANSVTLHLHSAHHGFIFAISQLVILPKHILSKEGQNVDLADYWENPLTTGMYHLVENNEKEIILEINPYYYARAPKIHTISINKSPFFTHDLYLSTNIATMEDMRSMHGFDRHFLPIHFYRYFAFNTAGDDGNQNPAMQDHNLRNAIAKAIDNNSIFRNLYANTGTAYQVQTMHVYDPIGARQLLELSNYDFNRPLKIGYYYSDSNSIYFVQTIGDYLKAVGFEVEFIREDSIEDHYQNRNFDILIKDKEIVHESDWYLELRSDHNSSRIFGTKGKYDRQIQHILSTQDTNRQNELMQALAVPLIEELYRYPILDLNQAIYTNNKRVQIPANQNFGNPWYITNLNFENWEIKKK